MSEIDKIIKEQNCSLMCDTVRQIANERNRFEARVKELEEKLNAQFTEMEEKLTAEELKNYEINKTVNKIEKVIEPYQNNFGAEALSLPVAIESILERMKQKGGELLAEKNAFQIGYNEHITRVKLLEEKLTIALNSLNDIATFDNYIVAQLDAQQALQKIKEVPNNNNININ